MGKAETRPQNHTTAGKCGSEEHVRECGGSQIIVVCEHNRQRSTCKECLGSTICPHKRIKSQCKECWGSQICEHDRQRSTMSGRERDIVERLRRRPHEGGREGVGRKQRRKGLRRSARKANEISRCRERERSSLLVHQSLLSPAARQEA